MLLYFFFFFKCEIFQGTLQKIHSSVFEQVVIMINSFFQTIKHYWMRMKCLNIGFFFFKALYVHGYVVNV